MFIVYTIWSSTAILYSSKGYCIIGVAVTYFPTTTGFRVYVCDHGGGVTPADADGVELVYQRARDWLQRERCAKIGAKGTKIDKSLSILLCVADASI